MNLFRELFQSWTCILQVGAGPPIGLNFKILWTPSRIKFVVTLPQPPILFVLGGNHRNGKKSDPKMVGSMLLVIFSTAHLASLKSCFEIWNLLISFKWVPRQWCWVWMSLEKDAEVSTLIYVGFICIVGLAIEWDGPFCF